ncbi:MAG TPA: hypothetical protein VF841_02910 [Anaeromyxobacter sp.]
MAITPPIFVLADELLVFDTVTAAESFLEPVDVEPGERGFDSEGRALLVRVVGEVAKGRFSVNQSRARVEIVLAEEAPTHAHELHDVLVRWLTAVEGAAPSDALAELVARAHTLGRYR